jgi:hypothetical protein
MPIFMVDYSISNHGQFNRKANEAMIAHNLRLEHAD